jgi:peptidoglycan/LPS O-acetylase OafA/YrhL
LRGLAVVFVMLDHASDAEMRLWPGADFNRAGKYGVYLFFVLSAFLLTHLLLARPASELRLGSTWRSYAWRRFARILPLYAVVLCALIALGKFKLSALAPHLLMLDGSRQFWTIPVEVKYYLLLPTLALGLAAGLRARWGLAAGAAAATVAAGAVLFQAEIAWSYTDRVHLAQNLIPFLIGSGLAAAHHLLARHAARLGSWAVAFEIAAIAALLFVVTRIPAIYEAVFFWDGDFDRFSNESTVYGFAWAAVLLGVFHGTGWLRQALAWRPLRWAGIVSYSAYLWHLKFVADFDDLPIPPPVRLAAYLAFVFALSAASYFAVERPLSRLR